MRAMESALNRRLRLMTPGNLVHTFTLPGVIMKIANMLMVGCGGFVGAVLRYGLDRLIHSVTDVRFPLGTLIVNVIGCFLIGVLMVQVQEHAFLDSRVRSFVIIGFIGSLTTFSTFSFETIQLIRETAHHMAFLNLLVSVVLGFGSVLAGRALAQYFT